MAESRFSSVYRAIQRRKRWIPLWLLLLTGLAGASFRVLPFDNTLQTMLPEGSLVQRMMAALREARFADKVAISLSVRSEAERGALKAAVGQLRRSLGPPLVTRIVTDLPQTNQLAEMSFFLQRAPQILDEADLAAIDRQLTPEGVEGALQRIYLQLLRPEGLFLGRQLQSDPLGIRGRVLGRLGRLSASLGYDVTMEDGLLLSRDRRHALLVVETPIALTDSEGSRRLVAYLREQLGTLPSGVSADMVCGHLHTLSNEKTVKRDIALTNTVASLAFIILLIAFFRDFRSVMLIFLIPVVAAMVAIPLTSLLSLRPMALLVIGLGSVIAGIAVDYGMHVYAAVRHSEDAEEAVRHVAKPVFFGALTTLALFVAFFASSIPAYHQLALFSILALLLSLAVALFILPQYVRYRGAERGGEGGAPGTAPRPRRAMDVVVAALWVVTILAGLPLARRVAFDAQITRLDGTEPAVLQVEESFQRTWGDASRNVAFMVVAGPTYESAMERSDRIFRNLPADSETNSLSGLSMFWPSAATRAANAVRWRQFWKDGREEKLRGLIRDAGSKFDFAEHAFDPFFASLYAGSEDLVEPAGNAMLAALKDRFVQQRGGVWQVVSFLPDRPEIVVGASRLAAAQSDAVVVSGRTIADALSRTFSTEIVRVSSVAVALIVLSTFWLLRSLRAALIALVPPVTAVVWLLALLALCGFSLNVATLMAGIVVFGLSIDYSFVMMHSYRHRLSGVTRLAVHLSAITTVLGTAALLFAQHPALFTIGITLTIGVSAGYIAAILVVPALCEVFLAGEGVEGRVSGGGDTR